MNDVMVFPNCGSYRRETGLTLDAEICTNDTTLAWADLRWLADNTALPVVAKGILHPDDARSAVAHGAAAVVVSNHGGRQVDGGVPAIETLPSVVAAVGGRVPVLVDSGIRTGSDVVKALALGAAAVMIGRPVLWGLAMGGARGVEEVFGVLRDEMECDMRSLGCAALVDVGRGVVDVLPPV